MIEINLVPDVKQELIRAQRIRTSVISLSILVGLIVAGLVVVLVLWVFVVEAARGGILDGQIKDRSQKLSNIPDISNTLTVQNQLAQLSTMHNNKSIDSRIFDILATINPPAPNTIGITKVSLDSASKTISIEAQAANQYTALELFQKTINATKFVYTDSSNTRQTVPLASQLSSGDRSYGQDPSGATVLRFTLSFVYPDALFSRTSDNAEIEAPNQKNATDSFLGVPNSLFTPKASDINGGKN